MMMLVLLIDEAVLAELDHCSRWQGPEESGPGDAVPE